MTTTETSAPVPPGNRARSPAGRLEHIERPGTAPTGRASASRSPTTPSSSTSAAPTISGVTAIARGHQAILDTIYARQQRPLSGRRRPRARPGPRPAVAGAILDAPTGPLRGINHSRITAVITRRDGRWVVYRLPQHAGRRAAELNRSRAAQPPDTRSDRGFDTRSDRVSSRPCPTAARSPTRARSHRRRCRVATS